MISRRNFLKIAGVTMAGAASVTASAQASTQTQVGRILHLTSLRDSQTRLLPDSVHPILGYQDGWVRLPDGWVPQDALQPMLPANGQNIAVMPTWVEVIAPYAAVRRWAAPDAPLVARLGHGATLQAAHALDDSAGRRWLQVDFGSEAGWVQAHYLQPAHPPRSTTQHHAEISDYYLTVYRNEAVLAQFALAYPADLPAAEHRIAERKPAHFAQDALAWTLTTTGGLVIGGVHWHNRFARTGDSPHIELSVVAAKAVYGLLGEGSRLLIR